MLRELMNDGRGGREGDGRGRRVLGETIHINAAFTVSSIHTHEEHLTQRLDRERNTKGKTTVYVKTE